MVSSYGTRPAQRGRPLRMNKFGYVSGSVILLTLSSCGFEGSAFQSGISATGIGSGSIVPLTNVCATLISQEDAEIAKLRAQLAATASMPVVVSAPSPVVVTPSPTGPVVTPLPRPVPGSPPPVVGNPALRAPSRTGNLSDDRLRRDWALISEMGRRRFE